jgi:hypothetical protein
MVLCVSRASGDTLRGMRHRLFSFGLAGLALGSLAMVGSSAIGSELGPLLAGYGLLVAISALYLVAGLAIRDRPWRKVTTSHLKRPTSDRLAGRRVF